MAYVDRQSGASKATSIATVAIVHAALGAVLFYGLAAKFVPHEEIGPIIATDFPLETPTPAPTVAPSATPSSTITTVNPPLDTKQTDVQVEPQPFPTSSEVFADPTPHPTIAPTVPATPTPPPLFTPKNPSPANDRSGWVTTADYPARDLRLGHTGTAKYRVVISSSGKVQSCEITGTSGFAGLDEATCKYVSRRARFDPASNSNGEKVVGTWSGSVSWRIPD